MDNCIQLSLSHVRVNYSPPFFQRQYKFVIFLPIFSIFSAFFGFSPIENHLSAKGVRRVYNPQYFPYLQAPYNFFLMVK